MLYSHNPRESIKTRVITSSEKGVSRGKSERVRVGTDLEYTTRKKGWEIDTACCNTNWQTQGHHTHLLHHSKFPQWQNHTVFVGQN